MAVRPREVRIGGRPIRVHDDQPTFWDRVEAGSWEPGTLQVLRTNLGPGTVFVDVGAWVGALSLYAASLGARVVALEADPKALDQLRRNLAANPGLAMHVDVVPGALSSVSGPVRMGAARKMGDSMSSVLHASREDAWTSPGITPAELIAKLPSARIDLLKVDIEGGEYGLLPALGPMLAVSSALLLALHPNILSDSGEPDPEGRARHMLEPLRGWNVARVDAGGLAPASLDQAARSGAAEWLFAREDVDAGATA